MMHYFIFICYFLIISYVNDTKVDGKLHLLFLLDHFTSAKQAVGDYCVTK